jgi:hypothetical protein
MAVMAHFKSSAKQFHPEKHKTTKSVSDRAETETGNLLYEAQTLTIQPKYFSLQFTGSQPVYL